MDEIDRVSECIRKAPGAMKWFAPWEADPNVEQSMSNHDELVRRIHHAQSVGCHVEVQSLKLQFADEWLRLFIKAKDPQQNVERLKQFGTVLSAAEKLGFDAGLVARLRAFAAARNGAQHGFVAGQLTYASIEKASEDHDGLVGETYRRVITTSGRVLTAINWPPKWSDRGDMVVDLRSLTDAKNPINWL